MSDELGPENSDRSIEGLRDSIGDGSAESRSVPPIARIAPTPAAPNPRVPRTGGDVPAVAAIKVAWATLLREPLCLVVGLVVGLIILMPSIALSFPQQLLLQELAGHLQQDHPFQFIAVSIGLSVVAALLTSFVTAYIQQGWITYLLNLARGRPAEIGDLFQDLSRYPAMLGSTLIFTISTQLGSMACILPGILLGLLFQFHGYFVMDKQTGPIGALIGSSRLVFANLGDVALLFGLSIVVFVAGACALIIGLIPAIVVLQIATAWLYLHFTKQTDEPDLAEVFA